MFRLLTLLKMVSPKPKRSKLPTSIFEQRDDFGTPRSVATSSRIVVDTLGQDASRSRPSTSRSSPRDREVFAPKQGLHPREVDSGYPASDRSARNSQFPSFDHSESSANGAAEPDSGGRGMRGSSPDPRSKRHSLPLSRADEGRVAGGSQSAPRGAIRPSRSFGAIPDEEYDASASSELDEEDQTRSTAARKHPKVYRTAFSKYEEKFVCPQRFQSSRESSQGRGASKQLGLAQIEKTSRRFEMQMNALKEKGLVVRGKTNRGFPSSGQSTPLKAVTKDCEEVSSPCSFSSSFLASSHSTNTPVTSTPKSRETFVFPVDCRRCRASSGESRHEASYRDCREFQKMRRSLSIPSLHKCRKSCSAPFIHIEYYK